MDEMPFMFDVISYEAVNSKETKTLWIKTFVDEKGHYTQRCANVFKTTILPKEKIQNFLFISAQRSGEMKSLPSSDGITFGQWIIVTLLKQTSSTFVG